MKIKPELLGKLLFLKSQPSIKNFLKIKLSLQSMIETLHGVHVTGA